MTTLENFAMGVLNAESAIRNPQQYDDVMGYIREWDEKYQLIPRITSEAYKDIEGGVEIDDEGFYIFLNDGNLIYQDEGAFDVDITSRQIGFITAAWASVLEHALDVRLPAKVKTNENKAALDVAQSTGDTSLEPDETERLAETLTRLGYKIVKEDK